MYNLEGLLIKGRLGDDCAPCCQWPVQRSPPIPPPSTQHGGVSPYFLLKDL